MSKLILKEAAFVLEIRNIENEYKVRVNKLESFEEESGRNF